MDFFQHQEVARKRTGRLVALFFLGVLGIAVSIYVVVAIGLVSQGGLRDPSPLAHPLLFLGVTAGVLAFVGGAAGLRAATVAKDGRSVAEFMRAKIVPRSTKDPDERRLLNVVEEMAIASGVPVPPVYVMEEPTINAFAAGRTPQDSVLGFTRGALLALDRDELQGVVGHEFSHVLNGDSRLNLRLMAWIFGIAALGQVGEFVLRSASFGSGMRGRSRSSKDGSGAGVVLGIGVGLFVVGGIGYFVGRLIQAAVSRQREFLADASSVQFTRNPDGIAGALAKIESMGSLIVNPHAGEVRHLMFGSVSRRASSLTATHPPIAERLARLGRLNLRGKKASPRARAELAKAEQKVVDGFVVSAGLIASLDEARRRLDRIPPELKDGAGDAFGAAATVLALLLSHGGETAELQMKALADWPELEAEVRRLRPMVAKVPALERLPAADLCVPALATMSTAQFERYWKVLEAFVVADGRFEPFEWALQEVVRARVFPRHGLATRPKQVVALDDVKQEVRAILSWVARASGDHDGGLGAYRAGVRVLREHGSAAFGSEPPLSAGAAATAVLRRGDHLRGLADVDRRAVLEACEVAAEHDGRLRPQEAELLRALAEAFGLEPRLTAARGPAESPDNPGAER